jgi:hypothetical protein
MASSRNRERSLELYQLQLAWAQTRLIEVNRAWSRRSRATEDSEIVLATDQMALQLRMALETIAYATMVTNESEYLRVRPKGLQDWHASRILKALCEANPNFYPWPFTISILETGTHFEAFDGPYLTQALFIEAYDKTGEMLHAPSPLRASGDYRNRAAKIKKWASLAETLVASHTVELPGVGFIFANVDRNTAATRVGLAEPVDGEPYVFKRPNPSGRVGK